VIPGAPENKRAHYTRMPISPIHAAFKLGYSAAFLSCDCGAQLDLNKVPNKTVAGEAFRRAHEECMPVTQASKR